VSQSLVSSYPPDAIARTLFAVETSPTHSSQ